MFVCLLWGGLLVFCFFSLAVWPFEGEWAPFLKTPVDVEGAVVGLGSSSGTLVGCG